MYGQMWSSLRGPRARGRRLSACSRRAASRAAADPRGAVQRLRSDAFIELLLASARSLCPLIRRFLSMGLNRVWLKAGHTAYQYASHSATLNPEP